MDSDSGEETLSRVGGEPNKYESTIPPESGYDTCQLDSVPANNSVDASFTPISSPLTSSEQTSSPQTSSPQTSSEQTSSPQTSSPQPSSPQTSSAQPSSAQTSSEQTSSEQTSSEQTSSPQTSFPQPSSAQTSSPQPSSPQTSSEQTLSPQPSSPWTSSAQTSRAEHLVNDLAAHMEGHSNDAQSYVETLAREGATKELYECMVLMTRRLIGKWQLQEGRIWRFSTSKKDLWFEVDAAKDKDMVQSALRAVHYLQSVDTSTESPTDEQKAWIEKCLIELDGMQGLKRSETYEEAKAAWESGASGVSNLASALENGILELLQANHCITPVRAPKLWLSVTKIRNQKQKPKPEAALLAAFNAAETVRFALELDLPASDTAVNKALDAVGDTRKFTRFCHDKIKRWKNYKWGPSDRNKQLTETLSLIEGLFDQIIKRNSNINISDLLDEAKQMKLIETSIDLTSDFRNFIVHNLLSDREPTYEKEQCEMFITSSKVISQLLEKACRDQGIELCEIWDIYLPASLAAMTLEQNRNRPISRSEDDSHARTETRLFDAHKSDGKILDNATKAHLVQVEKGSGGEKTEEAHLSLMTAVLVRSESQYLLTELHCQQGARPRSTRTKCRDDKDGWRDFENGNSSDDENKGVGPSGSRQGTTNSRRSNTSSRNSGNCNSSERKGGTTKDERNSTRSHQVEKSSARPSFPQTLSAQQLYAQSLDTPTPSTLTPSTLRSMRSKPPDNGNRQDGDNRDDDSGGVDHDGDGDSGVGDSGVGDSGGAEGGCHAGGSSTPEKPPQNGDSRSKDRHGPPNASSQPDIVKCQPFSTREKEKVTSSRRGVDDPHCTQDDLTAPPGESIDEKLQILMEKVDRILAGQESRDEKLAKVVEEQEALREMVESEFKDLNSEVRRMREHQGVDVEEGQAGERDTNQSHADIYDKTFIQIINNLYKGIQKLLKDQTGYGRKAAISLQELVNYYEDFMKTDIGVQKLLKDQTGYGRTTAIKVVMDKLKLLLQQNIKTRVQELSTSINADGFDNVLCMKSHVLKIHHCNILIDWLRMMVDKKHLKPEQLCDNQASEHVNMKPEKKDLGQMVKTTLEPWSP